MPAKASASITGAPQLMKRLNATKRLPKALGQRWADNDVNQNRNRVPVRTGKLRASFRVKVVTTKSARVVGSFTGYFVDAGTKPHTIKPKKARMLRFQEGNRTVFARAVHQRGYRSRPFRARAAVDAYRRASAAQTLIDLWNKAA